MALHFRRIICSIIEWRLLKEQYGGIAGPGLHSGTIALIKLDQSGNSDKIQSL